MISSASPLLRRQAWRRSPSEPGPQWCPVFLRWDPDRRHHVLHFQPPIELKETGDRAEDIVENTLLFNQILEKFVREFPDQWLWIHRRWKTRPEGEPSLY